jgi:MFS family permease
MLCDVSSTAASPGGDADPRVTSRRLLCSSLARVWPAYTIGFTGGFLVSALDPWESQLAVQFDWCNSTNLSTAALASHLYCREGSVNFALVSLSLFLGAILGCLVNRFVAEVGRVFILRAICVFVIPGSLLTGLAPDGRGLGSMNAWGLLIAGRAVAGVGMGWVCVSSPLYVSELAATEHRGKLLMVSMLAQSAGSFVAVALALAVTAPAGSADYSNDALNQWFWRAVVLTPVGLCGLALAALSRATETPYILCKRGRQAEARALLQQIHGRQDVEAEFSAADGQAQRALSKTVIPPESRLLRGEKRGEYWHALLVGAALGGLQNLSGARAVFTSATSIVLNAGLGACGGAGTIRAGRISLGTLGDLISGLPLTTRHSRGKKRYTHDVGPLACCRYDAVIVATCLLLLNVLANYVSTFFIDRCDT